MLAQYNSSFYQNQAGGSRKSARAIVPLVNKLVQPRSVLDVGCGVGTWLAEWVNQGVTDIAGLDGDHVNKAWLQIEPDRFTPADLSKPFSLSRKFDIVECLEVAEHLEPSHATQFVECLTRHGDIVLFSAAIPGQGGTHHINEQWPSYWAEKFSRAGFQLYDIVRPLIWSDPNIEFWYRQNILVFSRERVFHGGESHVDLVHPDLWTAKIKPPHPRELLRSLPRSLAAYCRRKLQLAGPQ